MSFKLHLAFKYRAYQVEVINSLFDYFANNSTGHPLVSAPGGTGKAWMIAGFICEVMRRYPNQRILQIVYVKELVEQNYLKLLKIWPNGHIGVYCAGLNRKDTQHAVVFGTIASIRNEVEAFGHRDLLIIDESQCVSPDEETGCRQIIAKLMLINPVLRVIGFSATNYRLGQGCLTNEGGLFTDICIDLTKTHHYTRFIDEGFLSPLIVPSQMKTQLDISGVTISKGDLNQSQLQKAVDKQEITYAAIQEALQYWQGRHCCLVFASGIKHCEHIAEIIQSFGYSATFVHSKITTEERDERIAAFKSGEVEFLVGFRILTTGFDNPPIDMIIDLYPTVSPGMHVQKFSRGTRPYDYNNPELKIEGFEYTKLNCLCLDFSNNTRRLGPINDPIVPHKKGDKTGDAPIKICEAVHDGQLCGLYNHASARYCGGKPYPSAEGCGAEFVFKTKLVRTAGTDELIRTTEVEAVVEKYDVSRVIYHKHVAAKKLGAKPCMRVSYYVGIQRFTEYVHIEAIGIARSRAVQWWQQRSSLQPPATTDEALLYVSQLRCPKSINVRTDLQYAEIISVEW
jgi:DNA repair protein RadD